ncbi:hypothetical protein ASPZODRAFT_133815 [Penicilliopsis zonata CBS 506.65]|uniref:Cytochrome P450 n=1 Tax=Penicilliopsis zonata CBS 506.65 TaxID=1073090 RepID=A0A1L9SFM0_9EURO|nr:hypothetical protein ASPZODRAFT_133815 [Penicilliopsis zonata CBS 506.65]OJJ45961.1 hypothetical protein ASPZODRAFT_133815 [Penicilliopsis zonata CBS 506.65]
MAPILVGPELGFSKEYVAHARGYTQTIPVWVALKFLLPSSLYSASSYVLPPGRAVRHHLAETRRLVLPEIRKLLADQGDDAAVESRSVLAGLVKLSAPDAQDDEALAEIVNQLLFVLFAGADLFAVVLSQLLLNILGHPQYEAELREELAAAGDNWTRRSAHQLPKLDSFLRETLRLSPPIICTIQRKAMEPIVLSDGTVLQPGDNVMVPTRGILQDPEIYPDPDRFDPYRFLQSQHQTVTQTLDYTVFGYGNQTCPGRFFGVMAAKMVFARLVMDYEMKFVPERKGKPVDWPRGMNLMPNTDSFVAFRRRSCSLYT